MGKDTVGKLSSELLQRDVYGDVTAGEQMSEQLRDYERSVLDCISHGKGQYTGDFYIVVVTKRERLMPNVFRNYFIARQSCPTPSYDQTVYRYHAKDENLEFLWTIPSIVAIKNIMQHKHELDPSLFQLLRFVLEFLDGTLEAKVRQLNKEIVDGQPTTSSGIITSAS